MKISVRCCPGRIVLGATLSPVRQRTKCNAKRWPRNSHEVLLILLCLCSTNNVGSAKDCDGLHGFHDLPCTPRYSKPFPTLPRLAQCGVPFRRADAQVLEGDPRQACRVNLWLVTCDMNIMNCYELLAYSLKMFEGDFFFYFWSSYEVLGCTSITSTSMQSLFICILSSCAHRQSHKRI